MTVVFPCHSHRSYINGSVASNMLGFKVPLFVGQGLFFLWAFSEKGSPRLFRSFISVIMKLYITYYSLLFPHSHCHLLAENWLIFNLWKCTLGFGNKLSTITKQQFYLDLQIASTFLEKTGFKATNCYISWYYYVSALQCVMLVTRLLLRLLLLAQVILHWRQSFISPLSTTFDMYYFK